MDAWMNGCMDEERQMEIGGELREDLDVRVDRWVETRPGERMDGWRWEWMAESEGKDGGDNERAKGKVVRKKERKQGMRERVLTGEKDDNSEE